METSYSGDREKREFLLEAVFFEQWLRFCWIAEESEGCFIRVPEAAACDIEKNFPQLKPLLECLNNSPVDAGLSCEAVLNYGRSQLGDSLDSVLASSVFQNRVTQFHLWLARKGEELENEEVSFARWKMLAAMTEDTAAHPL